jgi:3-oxoacyl-[acyl-carrier protein] reductase
MVTGSAGDIGSHLVLHFAANGWLVLGVDKRPVGASDAPNIHTAVCDLANGSESITVIDELSERYGAVDVLINCAGLIANAPLVTRGSSGWRLHDFAVWDEVLASGLTSAFHATANCVRHMLEARKKGVVVNISSVCAQGNAGQAAYSAAKAGLNGLTFALAKELGPLGIRVVGIAPGYFETSSTIANVAQAKLAKVTAAVPLKRLGRVDELADALDFVIGNQYLNGTVLELDGGLVL